MVTAIQRLKSPSGMLFTTLEALKGFPIMRESPLFAVCDQDLPALEKVYKALYDMTFEGVTKARHLLSSKFMFRHSNHMLQAMSKHISKSSGCLVVGKEST